MVIAEAKPKLKWTQYATWKKRMEKQTHDKQGKKRQKVG